MDKVTTICFNSVHFQPLNFEFIDSVIQIVLKLQINTSEVILKKNNTFFRIY